MSMAEIVKYAGIVYFVWIGLWFATAQAHFDRSSRARPLLFAVVALSAILSIATLYILIGDDVAGERLFASVVAATSAALLFRWGLRSIARKNLGLAFSGVVPPEVVEHGPYRFVRHPLYTAYSIFWLSCAYLTGSYLVAGLAVAVILLYALAARSEERDILRSNLGPAYRDYRRRTGLLFPRLLRKPQDNGSS